MFKNSIKIVITYIFASIFLLVLTFIYPYIKTSENNNTLVIQKGSNVKSIADLLYKKKIIYNKTYFYIVTYIKKADKKLKAGTYKLPERMSYISLVDLLTKGEKNNYIKVTIPEGIWLPDLAGLLKNKIGLDSSKVINLANDEKFIKSLNLYTESLEGYLLPETYYFDKSITEEQVLKFLVKQSKSLFDSNAVKKMNKLNMNMHQILTLASIIDGESNRFDEFDKISSVYYNRLKLGMPLQADPTIQYIFRQEKLKRILYKHLAVDSPFNTYKNAGLPPAPINNPGKQAINAALNPANTNYYYFVVSSDGAHVFAVTLAEHNKNVKLYREFRKKRERIE